MTRLTRELIRKKAEHHDGIIGDLEEISLHQLELEKLEVIGELCRKLQILYLQNNIIPKIENIHYCKDLRYLNMALNNIQKIEGLQSCEFLEKLDLTVNFVDLDHFQGSIEHLIPLAHFKELFLMGNPCMEWAHAKDFIIATLPQLERLDGQDITRTERIKAKQGMQGMLEELHAKAKEATAAKRAKELEELKRDPDDDSSPWTPAARVELYREVQEQKEADEARRKEMEPRERDAEKEHKEKTQAIREEEERAKALLAAAGADGGDSAPPAPAAAGGSEPAAAGGSGKPTNLPRMANEGRIDFSLEDEDGKGNCVLRLPLPRFMDTSLVDLDVHPWYVSAVIKNKLFRIHWPEEVRADAGSAKRSTTSGELVITVPKLFPRAAYMSLVQREKAEEKARKRAERSAAGGTDPAQGGLGDVLGGKTKKGGKGGKKGPKKVPAASGTSAGGGNVMDMIMSAAASAKSDKKKKKKSSKSAGGSKAVSVAGIVPQTASAATGAAMTEKSTKRTQSQPDSPGTTGAPKELPRPAAALAVTDEAGGVLELKQAAPAGSGIQEID